METITFHRLPSDINGNPRYVVDYTYLLKDEELNCRSNYEFAVKRANTIGGFKYDRKAYGGGIGFSSYSIDETANAISRVTGRQFNAIKG